jgi:hydrogenase large subunit
LTRLVVGPFNRVEGDLEVRLEVADGRVSEARVVSPLYRGYEQILHGKDPRDALVIAPRICGICSVSQSMAAAYALADIQPLAMPPNGELATNLILACENLADHLTHFYLFFMPDFARDVYAVEPWYPAVEARFRALSGEAAREVLPARAQFMHLMGILAGKWPHSLSLQPGGSTRPVQAQERLRIGAILAAFRSFLERRLFGDDLESVAAIASTEALDDWRGRRTDGDLRAFLTISEALGLGPLGAGPGHYMSYGAYPVESDRVFRPGVWSGGPQPLDLNAIREDLTHAWMGGSDVPLHPAEGVTLPDADRSGAYSWCKAPRLDGRPMEVGALARQLVQGHPLIRDLVARGSAGVAARVLARLLELALVLPVMEDWARRLKPGEPFCIQGSLPRESTGFGLVEAARGSLGHWLSVRNGRILNYQIVAPTTWNFSPRDRDGVPGPLEQALVGAPVRSGEAVPVAVQHIVRSFDPCMVCTVH